MAKIASSRSLSKTSGKDENNEECGLLECNVAIDRCDHDVGEGDRMNADEQEISVVDNTAQKEIIHNDTKSLFSVPLLWLQLCRILFILMLLLLLCYIHELEYYAYPSFRDEKEEPFRQV